MRQKNFITWHLNELLKIKKVDPTAVTISLEEGIKQLPDLWFD